MRNSCLAVMNFKHKRLEFYDSMRGPGARHLNNLARYLHDESNHKRHIPCNVRDWERYVPQDIPVQANGYDCGVFVIKYAEKLCMGQHLTFTQADLPRFRREVVLALLDADTRRKS